MIENKPNFNLDELPTDLPILTDIVKTPATTYDPHTQQLVAQLEGQIEGLLQQKLLVQFEQLQLNAITQAVNELKAELPALIRRALQDQALVANPCSSNKPSNNTVDK